VAELKTKATKASVPAFLTSVEAERRDDCEALVEMMEKATGAKGVLWGSRILGFGERRLVYDSGRELDWFEVGFSPRKGELVLYGVTLDAAALQKLGKHKTGKGCLYVKRLADVDANVLRGMIRASVTRKRGKEVSISSA
jgi:hypothetical protein